MTRGIGTDDAAPPDDADDGDGSEDGAPLEAEGLRAVVDPSKKNWRVTLSYDGTRYVGWERQKNGLAVQEVVEDALFRLTGERIPVAGSGRTDAGVHAFGQVASFRMARPMVARKLRLAINALLPMDVAAVDCVEAPDDFHARFSAKGKTYRYEILNGPIRLPLGREHRFHFPQRLDADRMSRAAGTLVGTHDFRAFARESWRRKNCVRTIFSADVSAEDLGAESRFIRFEIHGSGFLYNMVRILAGTLIDVGVGRRSEDCFVEILASGRRAAAGFTVPPTGLCLVGVDY